MRALGMLGVGMVASLALTVAAGAAPAPVAAPLQATPPCPPPAAPPGDGWHVDVPIASVADDGSSITVLDGSALTLAARSKDLQGRLNEFHRGDWVSIKSGDGKNVDLVIAACQVRASVGRRVWTLLGALILVLLGSGVVLRRRLADLVVGQDQRYSNSKVQIVVWFGVLVVTYLATLYLRAALGGAAFIGGINLPQNLVLISGMSAFTFAAAKGITSARIEAARQQALAAGGGVTAVRAAEERLKPVATQIDRRRLANLFTDDTGRVDVGDFQMLVITLLAVLVYMLQVFAFMGSIDLLKQVTLPDVDSTILATFGLGQGAYLTKKYAGTGV